MSKEENFNESEFDFDKLQVLAIFTNIFVGISILKAIKFRTNAVQLRF